MDLMHGVFKLYLDKFVVVFINDILIHSKTKEKHATHLCLVLRISEEHKLYAKLKKCEFWMEKVHFPGYVVTEEGKSIHPAKIETILNWPTPTYVTKF